jgi:hypothetical protein
MPNILKILHYVVFGMGFVTAMDLSFDYLIKGLVVLCNAILVSVAVWNQSAGPASPSVCERKVSFDCLSSPIYGQSLSICILSVWER